MEILHELDNSGRHRLVLVTENDVKTGAWVSTMQTATLDKLFANIDAGSVFPIGVFTVREVTHKGVG